MNQFNRRQLLKAASLGLLGASASGWFPAFAEEVEGKSKKRRHCVLLWMSGGPSQLDTWDMKPGHKNGGEFKEIATKVPGVRFSEHMPKLGTLINGLMTLPDGRAAGVLHSRLPNLASLSNWKVDHRYWRESDIPLTTSISSSRIATSCRST